MFLLINTVDEKPYVALAKSAKIIGVDFLKGEGAKRSEDATLAIKRVCAKYKIKLNKISVVGAVTGPGSFSASRAGVAVANALGYALTLKVVGVHKKQADKVEDFLVAVLKAESKTKTASLIMPTYDSQPNITIKK
jgi:tRNA A37 threonylcarbamoyladenosine modification protein TsaB